MINLPPNHPGTFLRDDQDERRILPAGSVSTIEMPKNRFSEVLNERHGIAGDTALRLGHYFGTGEMVWMNPQSEYDLALARQKSGRAIAALPKLPPEEGAVIG